MKKLLYIILILIIPIYSYSLPAFPGAEGMGASTVGGRGGTVIIVDQLGDDAAAEAAGTTLREACETSGARYVVFAVSGVIWLESRLIIENDYLTIAGETSPNGIVVAGWQTTFDGVHDVIVRNMRFRVGAMLTQAMIDDGEPYPYDNPLNPSYCAISVQGKSALGYADGKAAAGTDPSYNIIFDHCSFSWAPDTNVNLGYDYYNITFSWCSIIEGVYGSIFLESSHNLGLLSWGRYNSTVSSGGVTIHHTYFGDNLYRNPATNGHGFMDQTNNVVYHFTPRIATKIAPTNVTYSPTMNMVNNYTDVRHADNPGTNEHVAIIFSTGVTPYEALYMSGNIQSTLAGSTPAWDAAYYGDFDSTWGTVIISTDWQKDTKFAVNDIEVTATTMDSTYASYVVANAGAKPFDSVDVASQLKYTNNTGLYRDNATIDEESDWPTIAASTSPTDSNSNGIADNWETAVFGGLVNATDDADSDGYDNIEEYLHYLVDPTLDEAPPTVTAFSIPETYTSIPVPVESFIATDNVGVTGYIVTASAVAPAYTASGWTPSPTTALDFLVEGVNTVYAWAKDAVGLVSLSATDDCTVTLPEPGVTWEDQPTWSVTWEDQPTWQVTWE